MTPTASDLQIAIECSALLAVSALLIYLCVELYFHLFRKTSLFREEDES